MRESLIGAAVGTLTNAAKSTADILIGSSTTTSTSASASEGEAVSSVSSSSSSTTSAPTTKPISPAATTIVPASSSTAFSDNSSGTGYSSSSSEDISVPSSMDRSSSASMSDIASQVSSHSASYLGSSEASGESIIQRGIEDEGLSSASIIAIWLSCSLLLIGAFALWYGRSKHWFRKTTPTTLSIYATADNIALGVQTPVIDLRSPFQTNNVDSSLPSNVSSIPIAMWEDEDVTAMRIPLEKLTTTKLISYGGHGEVYLGIYRGERVAIKRLLPEKRKRLHEVNGFLSEIKIMANLCAVSEFMEGGDLHSLLTHYEADNHPHGFDFNKARIALQVAHALAYLHSLDPIVLHRDLKSMNILLTPTLEAKITDFGVSRQWSNDTMTAGVGTALWMAPEVMLGESYGASADIFSFGVVLSELDSHLPPYRETWSSSSGQKISGTALLELVALGQLRIKFSLNAPSELAALGHACVDLVPTARPSAREVLYRLQLILRMYEAYTI